MCRQWRWRRIATCEHEFRTGTRHAKPCEEVWHAENSERWMAPPSPFGLCQTVTANPFFRKFVSVTTFFCYWPPFLLLPLTCRGFTSSSSTLSCWLKTQWQKKPCVLCLLCANLFLRVATTVNWPRKNFYCLFVKLESATVKDLDWLFFTSKCWK